MSVPTSFAASNKRALVTGAGSGINFEFASLLASRACKVLIADLALRPEAEALVQSSGGNVVFHKTNVTDWTDLSAAFDKAVSTFGGLDIVCPGAGVYEPPWSSFWYPPGGAHGKSVDSPDGLGHFATLDINITHPVRATQLAIAEFLNPANGGDKVSPSNPKMVIHCASVASEVAGLRNPLYNTSKFAIAGFVRSMASLEAMTGIRVSAIAPGLVKTALWTDSEDKMQVLKQDEAVAWMSPAEVAEAMVRLMEDPDLPGGSMLEVAANHQRVIPTLGNPGPPDAVLTAVDREKSLELVKMALADAQFGRVVNRRVDS